jgi:hypothetical protein
MSRRGEATDEEFGEACEAMARFIEESKTNHP